MASFEEEVKRTAAILESMSPELLLAVLVQTNEALERLARTCNDIRGEQRAAFYAQLRKRTN